MHEFCIKLLNSDAVVTFILHLSVQDQFPASLEDIVLAVLTINLMRPAFVLWSLFMDHYSSKRFALAVKIGKSLMGKTYYV